ENLKWAGEVKQALARGLESTIRDLQAHRREIESLPDSGVPGKLKKNLTEDLNLLNQRLQKDDFYRHAVDFNSQLTNIKSQVRDAVGELKDQMKLRLKEGVEDLNRMSEWEELTQEERSNVTSSLESQLTEPSADLNGLKQLLAQDFNINNSLSRLKEYIRKQGQERRLQRLEEERAKAGEKGSTKFKKSVLVPASLSKAEELDELIRLLQEIRNQARSYTEIEVSIEIENTKQYGER
ncbi:MAG: BREX system P-loop protein BrxC, partial [Acidobacteria bacterium]|nr:BREX system P-loop protein BrxC [Acidobacteriota bacterium]